MYIAVDFDGTIVEHRYPKIGREIPFAIETLRRLREDGHLLILWTVREGRLLDEAVKYCNERGIDFYAINRNYEEEDPEHGSYTRKLKVDVFIDDRNVGGLPGWDVIYKSISTGRSFMEICLDEAASRPPRRQWWQFWR